MAGSRPVQDSPHGQTGSGRRYRGSSTGGRGTGSKGVRGTGAGVKGVAMNFAWGSNS